MSHVSHREHLIWHPIENGRNFCARLIKLAPLCRCSLPEVGASHQPDLLCTGREREAELGSFPCFQANWMRGTTAQRSPERVAGPILCSQASHSRDFLSFLPRAPEMGLLPSLHWNSQHSLFHWWDWGSNHISCTLDTTKMQTLGSTNALSLAVLKWGPWPLVMCVLQQNFSSKEMKGLCYSLEQKCVPKSKD